jgi:hypothetical protein
MKKFLILITAVATFSACQKASDELFQLNYERAFMPTTLNVETTQSPETQVTAIFAWIQSPGVSTYRVQLTTDTTFEDINAFDGEVDLTAFTRSNLPFSAWNTPGIWYGFRVMALSPPDSEQANSKWNQLTFRTPSEQLFLPLRTSGAIRDLRSDRVNLRWLSNQIPSQGNIVLRLGGHDGSVVRTITIASQDSTFLIDNLEPATQYTVQLRQATQIRGQLTFTTNRGVNCSAPNVHCLEVGDDLVAVLQNPAFDGYTIYLPEGFEQIITSSINISGNRHIFGTLDGDRPKLMFEGNNENAFFTLPASIEFLVFENVQIVGLGAIPAPSYYVINASTAVNMGTLRFDNCVITDFGQGFFRLGGAERQDVENLVINNSVFERFGHERVGGRFGFIHIEHSGTVNSKVNNILITNSTFSYIHHSFMAIRGQGQAGLIPTVDQVTIENVTFDRAVSSDANRYLIDGTANMNVTVTIRNTIFGSTNGPLARGIRLNPSSRITIEGSFKTRDWVTTNPAPPSTDDFHIPGLIDYNGDRTDLFANPNNGDFTIIDAGFTGRNTTGDPRWRP